MKILQRPSLKPYGVIVGAILLILTVMFTVSSAQAQSGDKMPKNGQRLITVHDNGQEKTILTSAKTLRQAFSESNIPLDKSDLVEPGIDDPLVATDYQTNIYRARPVTIVDGNIRQKVMSAYRTARQIAEHAGTKLQDQDTTTLERATNIIQDGPGITLKIDRATAFTLVLYGKKTAAYSQAKTVGEMLSEKTIALQPDDTLSVDKDTALSSGMTIELWRNGKQTISEEQSVAFPTEQVQDADQPVGYKKITTPGTPGKKTVSYEVIMKNGKEVSRQEIQSIVTLQPQKQVEVVGAKPSFGGDFAAALAKLRSCEGGYNSYNPAGYYGAYQFDSGTWASVSSAPYGSATPAQQDAAARALYVRRGWSPWPNCGRGIPDIYR